MSPHHLILNPMIDTSHAGDFISSPSLAIRMRRAITLAWEIFGRKVGGGLIPVNKEASMQLQYAYVLKQLLPLILQHPDERADVELETGVQLEGERGRNNIDILVMGESLEGKTKIAIELKCYRDVTATGGKRGATDIFMKDVYVDLHILERYVEQGVADAGVALVMNDLRRLVKPSEKNGKAWAYDISDGFTFPGGRIAVDVGGKPVEVSLNRRYPFQWSQFGSLWFAEIEGLAVTSPPTPSGHVDSHHREDLLHTESDQA